MVPKAGPEPRLLWDAGVVRVWIAPLALPPSALCELHQTLSADERARADGYRLPRMGNEFIVRRGLLRVLLSRELNRRPDALSIFTDPSGKPLLAPGEGYFSVSSSRDYAVWAFSHALPVGVDIEWVDSEMPLDALINDHFSPSERERFAVLPGAAERTDSFFRAWTGKEACVKATGIGLSAPLTQYDILSAQGTLIDTPQGTFRVASLRFPLEPDQADYRISFALAQSKLRRVSL